MPSHRLRVLGEVEALRCSAHYRQMITAAWQLGGNRHGSRFRAWAHMLGYGGHFLTKSRRYSVTFGQLRQARTDHRRQLRPPGTATPGAGPSMRPSCWSCPRSGPTTASATPRQRKALSWPQHPPPVLVSITNSVKVQTSRPKEKR